MSIDDQSARKEPLEVPKLIDSRKTSDTTSGDAVIGASPNQDRWKAMEQSHYLEQDESATDLFGDQGSATCKFGIDGLDDKPKLAYDLKDAQRDFNTGAKRVGTFFDCSMQSLTSFEKPASLDPFHPRAGNEDAYISYQACAAANLEFPELKGRLGAGPCHIDKALIAATIRHEVAFYKQGFDSGQDKYIREHGQDEGMGSNTSIGPAQMQIRHINRLIHQFPWQLGHFAKDPLRAALKPENAPHFVAAYFSDAIQHLTKGTKPTYIGSKDWDDVKKYWSGGDYNAALIYAYNPRIDHIEGVKQQMALIQKKF